ncbi:hypothetical protein [Clostridium perfringens]|jgi:uncharacterized membrane protein (Fun14 family)|uniref:hypothetical protein n=1 Tax=Clostridium perfringens TaxID=1502 RepID=UPI0018ABDDC6|nr:hypothetical protein [Clostridium perfringens]MBI6057658.1 hypothetical protein [Clostridium perfringens]MDB2070327.1 hypothetical protein [Clostridium perfringens]MDJ8945293.1 hypothetical protein [Clostridium perfringens]MDK0704644.1 hypothetical protein [Clostridium perfringens]MDK0817851.1 hypothetical protein [Clostridium perfringens]
MNKIKIIKTLGIINVGILGMLILKQNGLIPTDGQIINTIKGMEEVTMLGIKKYQLTLFSGACALAMYFNNTKGFKKI